MKRSSVVSKIRLIWYCHTVQIIGSTILTVFVLNLTLANRIEYFSRIKYILKEDCPLIGCIPGNDTLYELRTSLQIAQQEIEGGISPHVSPTLQTQDMSNVLNNAGFHLITGISWMIQMEVNFFVTL